MSEKKTARSHAFARRAGTRRLCCERCRGKVKFGEQPGRKHQTFFRPPNMPPSPLCSLPLPPRLPHACQAICLPARLPACLSPAPPCPLLLSLRLSTFGKGSHSDIFLLGSVLRKNIICRWHAGVVASGIDWARHCRSMTSAAARNASFCSGNGCRPPS